jgi:hypothetical protein
MGPLEFLVIGFEGNRFSGEIMPELNSLRDRGVIRVLDLLFVKRDEYGEVSSFELSDLPAEEAQNLTIDEGSGEWFAQGDIEQIGESLANQSSVAMVLLEHLWAVPLQQATIRANGRLMADGLVPRDVVEEVESLIHARP